MQSVSGSNDQERQGISLDLEEGNEIDTGGDLSASLWKEMGFPDSMAPLVQNEIEDYWPSLFPSQDLMTLDPMIHRDHCPTPCPPHYQNTSNAEAEEMFSECSTTLGNICIGEGIRTEYGELGGSARTDGSLAQNNPFVLRLDSKGSLQEDQVKSKKKPRKSRAKGSTPSGAQEKDFPRNSENTKPCSQTRPPLRPLSIKNRNRPASVSSGGRQCTKTATIPSYPDNKENIPPLRFDKYTGWIAHPGHYGIPLEGVEHYKHPDSGLPVAYHWKFLALWKKVYSQVPLTEGMVNKLVRADMKHQLQFTMEGKRNPIYMRTPRGPILVESETGSATELEEEIEMGVSGEVWSAQDCVDKTTTKLSTPSCVPLPPIASLMTSTRGPLSIPSLPAPTPTPNRSPVSTKTSLPINNRKPKRAVRENCLLTFGVTCIAIMALSAVLHVLPPAVMFGSGLNTTAPRLDCGTKTRKFEASVRDNVRPMSPEKPIATAIEMDNSGGSSAGCGDGVIAGGDGEDETDQDGLCRLQEGTQQVVRVVQSQQRNPESRIATNRQGRPEKYAFTAEDAANYGDFQICKDGELSPVLTLADKQEVTKCRGQGSELQANEEQVRMVSDIGLLASESSFGPWEKGYCEGNCVAPCVEGLKEAVIGRVKTRDDSGDSGDWDKGYFLGALTRSLRSLRSKDWGRPEWTGLTIFSAGRNR